MFYRLNFPFSVVWRLAVNFFLTFSARLTVDGWDPPKSQCNSYTCMSVFCRMVSFGGPKRLSPTKIGRLWEGFFINIFWEVPLSLLHGRFPLEKNRQLSQSDYISRTAVELTVVEGWRERKIKKMRFILHHCFVIWFPFSLDRESLECARPTTHTIRRIIGP